MITLINNSAILMINKITASVNLYLQVISAVQGGEEPSLKLATDHWQVVDIMISINISFMKIFNIIITMIVVSIKISMFMKILNIMMISMKPLDNPGLASAIHRRAHNCSLWHLPRPPSTCHRYDQ